MLPFAKASELVLNFCKPQMPTETVSLENAPGRVLAESVFADRDFPPYNRATMDGFAFRSQDLHSGKRIFSVSDKIFAGDKFGEPLQNSHSVKIMTGGVVPKSFDSVVPIEFTKQTVSGEVRVDLPNEIVPRNIALCGEDAKKGTEVLRSGDRLTPLKIAVCASTGKTKISVYKKPQIRILSTGSELVTPEEIPQMHQIRDCNSNLIASFCETVGFPCESARRVDDDPDRMLAEIQEGLPADILILSGGVSMGEKDLVPGILQRCGVRPIFHKVNIRPGKPLWFGQTDSCTLFALPGNPISVHTNLKLFVEPFLRGKVGEKPLIPLKLMLETPVKNPSEKDWFLPGEIQNGCIRPLKINSSGDFCNAAQSGGFFRIPPQTNYREGQFLEFFPC